MISDLLFELCSLFLDQVFALHIIIPYKMISLDASAFRRFAIGEFLPGQHALANMNTTIVYHACRRYIIPIRFKNFSNTTTEKIISKMSEVKRFVCIG